MQDPPHNPHLPPIPPPGYVYPKLRTPRSVSAGLVSIGMGLFAFIGNCVAMGLLMSTVEPGEQINQSGEVAIGSMALAVVVPLFCLIGILIGVTGVLTRSQHTLLAVIGIFANLVPIACACGFFAMVMDRG